MNETPDRPALEVRGLTKRYSRHAALDGVDFSVPRGCAAALLGRNGAGKSTLIKVLLGLIRPSGGEAEIFGHSSQRLSEAARGQIGYVADGQDLPDWMTVQEFLGFLRPLYPAWEEAFCARLQKMFELPMARRLKELSRGQRTKAALLGALAARPRLLLLDEPFGGLDPAVREEIVGALIELMNREEWTILICSHELDEIERLSDRVALLEDGRLILDEEKDHLLERCRAVSIHTDRGMNGSGPPPEWWNFQQGEGRATFVDTAHAPERLDADVRRLFPGASHLVVERAPLKTICLAALRKASATATPLP